MRTSDFDYALPENLIAYQPPEIRGDSKMLVLDRHSGKTDIRRFHDIVDYLSPGDVMVLNDTKVIKARLLGRKKDTGGRVEFLLVSPLNDNRSLWTAMGKPAKRIPEGAEIELLPTGFTSDPPPKASIIVTQKNRDGSFEIKLQHASFDEVSIFFGHTPLPPYIKRPDIPEDSERYQTVYAERPGAVAAPTAGLHFTKDTLKEIEAKGVSTVSVTLHIGPGTFQPVKASKIEDHAMHSEFRIVSQKTADAVNFAKQRGNKVLAVGTTVVRALESAATPDGVVFPAMGETAIFLRPPMRTKIPDMLLTNFHLPKSTLLMLTATLAPLEHILDAYREAINAGLRFHSYGDCMLIK